MVDLGYTDDSTVNIFFVKKDGNAFRLTDTGLDSTIYVGDREYVQRVKNVKDGTFYIGEPFRARLNGRLSLPLVLRARDNPYGVQLVVAAITGDHLAATFKDLLVTAPFEIGLVRQDGTTIFSAPDTMQGKITPGASDVIGQRSFGDRAIVTIADVDGGGGQSLTAYMALPEIPYTIFASFKTRDLDQIWLKDIGAYLATSIFMTLVSLAGTAVLVAMVRRTAEKATALERALVKAVAAAESKRNFLANMSHELRTPLNAIIGFADMMYSEALGEHKVQQYRGYCRDVLSAGKHLLSIIEGILDTARMEHGTLEIGTEKINVRSVIRGTTQLLDPVSVAKHVAVMSHIEQGLPQLEMSKAHLQQLLFNLIGNAIKFSKDGAMVDVIAKRADDDRLLISIQDSGIGIPKDRIADLFTPFTKVDSFVVRNHEGIGLGLANCKLIVDAYGGRIWIDSTLGKGTVVNFLMPFRQVASVGEPAAA
jgi:signal transduction histidine kinase